MTDKYIRIAIVTGATSGIGEALVKKFVAADFGVVGNGRNAEKLDALENEMGSAFCGVAGDAADNIVLDKRKKKTMRQSIKDFATIVAEYLPNSEPIYEFGSLQVPGQEGFADLRQEPFRLGA